MALQLHNKQVVERNGMESVNVTLWSGNLALKENREGIDYLVVSALPNDYSPASDVLIKGLSEQGLSVQKLSEDKEEDLRDRDNATPCWISKPLDEKETYKRIIVFEPDDPSKNACTMVPYIFSAAQRYIGEGGTPACLAVPLVCTSGGEADSRRILEELFYAAVHWAGGRLPFSEIRIVMNTGGFLKQYLLQDFEDMMQAYADLYTIDVTGFGEEKDKVLEKIDTLTLPSFMTKRQLFGIMMYTSDFFKVINPTLRADDPTDETYKKLRPLFEAADTGLMNCPFSGYAVNYRTEGNMDQNRIEQNAPGKKIRNLAYTSTTYDDTEEYYQKALFQFQFDANREGALVSDYSLFPAEKEILHRRWYEYQVLTVKTSEIQQGTRYHFEANALDTDRR